MGQVGWACPHHNGCKEALLEPRLPPGEARTAPVLGDKAINEAKVGSRLSMKQGPRG